MQHLAAIGHRQRIPSSPEDASRGVVCRDQEQATGRAEERPTAPAPQDLSYLPWSLAAGSRELCHQAVSA